MRTFHLLAAVLLLVPSSRSLAHDPTADLKKAVLLYASFDEKVQADRAGGGKTLSTRFNHPTETGRFVFEKGFDVKVFRIAPTRGISGGALEAVDVLPRNGRIFFPGQGNLAFSPQGWGGAFSVWCKTDPDLLLKTTFCDPVQITEKGAGNGGLWFDFDNARPRTLRHGVFPAVPAGGKPIPENAPHAPLVRVPKVGWKASDWHHVVVTWSGFDSGKANAVSRLFIDGKLQGEIRGRPLAMKWDLEKTGIYIAVNYIGLLDELAVFERPLTPAEIQHLQGRPGCLK